MEKRVDLRAAGFDDAVVTIWSNGDPDNDDVYATSVYGDSWSADTVNLYERLAAHFGVAYDAAEDDRAAVNTALANLLASVR